MLVVIFMRKTTEIVALHFLRRTTKENFCVRISCDAESRIETDRTTRLYNFQESCANSIKLLATFCKTFSFLYLEN